MALIDEAGFKESEHPRGRPGNAGQFAPAGGGGSSKIQGTGNGAKVQPDFKGSLAHETSGDTTQPVRSLDELYEKARKAEGPFKATVDGLAKKYDGEASYTPEQYAEPGTILKSRSSAERKMSSELGNDPKLLRDVIRATVITKTVESTRRAAADFIGEHGDSILRVKDRYVDQIKGGYRDILINYRTPEGLVAEIQFNSKNMVTAKNETAHALYEKARSLIKPDLTMIADLERQMSDIYEVAYKADGNGNGWKHNVAAHDAVGDKVFRQYKLEGPDGEKFEAAIIEKDGVASVVSTRMGKWAPDEALSWADLIMPEQRLGSDWEVRAVTPGEISEIDALDTGGVLRATDGFQRRAIDRRHRDTADIEYYTSESLGPNRDRTPEGFLICYDVPAARIGEMTYGPREVPPELGVGKDGSIRVTRSEAEVFDPRSMASLNGKPVTDDHPPVDVDPKNWKFYTKGVVVNPRRGEDEHKDFLVVDLIIYDEDTIADIEAGKREVSCGYNPDYLQLLDPVTLEPILGRGEQVKIRYNHLALVKAGRCGPFCSIGDSRTVDDADSTNIIDTFFTPARARRLEKLLRRLAR